jgi:hypothetical protein
MKKLTLKQVEMLWGETGPYSQANLKKEVRILGDAVSRVFLIVEVDINPTTFEIIRNHRDSQEFVDDPKVQQLLDHSEHRGPFFGYVSMAFEREYVDESVMYAAETALNYSQNTIIKMHRFVMDHYVIESDKSTKAKENSITKRQILKKRREIEMKVVNLLKETGSDFVLDDLIDVIYHEKNNEDMQKLILMFDDGHPENLDNIIEVVSDAWNFFPHKSLKGKCPEEMILYYKSKNA